MRQRAQQPVTGEGLLHGYVGSPRGEIQHTFRNRCPNYSVVRTATDITATIFLCRKQQNSAEYETGWEITDIFHNSSIGIATARDKLTIHRTS